jgi:hypothetical protein
MSYKVKIKIDTDSDFTLMYDIPKFPYKFKSIGGKISMTIYLTDVEEKAKTQLVEFLRILSINTYKDNLKEIFEERVYRYSEELYDQGLHSNHNLLSGNYEMEVIILKQHSEYL